MAYSVFAEVYDRLMSDCDYHARAEYLLGLFSRFGKKPKLMLDLCCGTGSMSVELMKQGIDVIAVDMSSEMLSVAKEKAANMNYNMLCLCQDATKLDLFGTVDGAICTLDSLNHIIDYDDMCEAIAKVSLFLEPGCLFVFDVNTQYKHSDILANNTFVIDDEDVYCVWQNYTEDNITDITLDLFIRSGDNYHRGTEQFSERAYTDSEIDHAIEMAGLEKVAVFADMTFEAPMHDCERKIYTVRKK